MAELRWGILGCGGVTEKKSGPPAFNQEGSSLVAVMRRDSAKASDYAERHGVARWYTDAERLVEDADVNAVYVAAPVGAHADLARRVAAGGKPCYLEKPMARSYRESKELADAFAAAGVPLFVAYYRRAYPRFQRLRRLLHEEKAVGGVTGVLYRKSQPPPQPPAGGGAAAAPWRLDAEASGGGLFVDVGSHVLDLLDFLLGPLQEVCGAARGPQGAVESQVAASFAWPCGAVGSATWDFGAPLSEDVLEIRGTAGVLTLPELMNGDETLLRRAGSEETVVFSDVPPPVVQRPLISTVIEALRKGDSSLCPSTAASALRTAQAMDAILHSYYNGREDDFWKRPHTWQTRGPQYAHEALGQTRRPE